MMGRYKIAFPSTTISKTAIIFLMINIFSHLATSAGDSTFNYEISARVSDRIQSFLGEVRIAANVPVKSLESGAVNVTNFAPYFVYETGRNLLFSLQQLYRQQITTFQLGFENKFYFCYQNFDNLPHGMAMWASSPHVYTIRQAFQVASNGMPTFSYLNASFDCTVNISPS